MYLINAVQAKICERLNDLIIVDFTSDAFNKGQFFAFVTCLNLMKTDDVLTLNNTITKLSEFREDLKITHCPYEEGLKIAYEDCSEMIEFYKNLINIMDPDSPWEDYLDEFLFKFTK